VGLDPEGFAVIEAWLALRAQLPRVRGSASLLCTLDGAPLDPGYCRALIKRLAKRAGVTGRAHLHGLRHAHAVAMLREGAPLPALQAQLGHRSLSVTGRYLAHVSPADLARLARARASWARADEAA